MAAVSSGRPEACAAPRDEDRSFRLSEQLRQAIEDVARGVEAGEAGLKSCALGALAAGDAGAAASEVVMRHYHEVQTIGDEDECFNAIGDALANGFSLEEVTKAVQLDSTGTHLLALERWCQLVRLSCRYEVEPPTPLASRPWKGSASHERRRRCERTIRSMRGTPDGARHAAVLHVVYGWPDPFLNTLPPETRTSLGKEFAPLARYTDAVEAERQRLIAEEVHRYVLPENAADHWVADRLREIRAHADRCISSGDALRVALAPARARLETESKEEYRESVLAPVREAREAFLTQVRIEANRMLSEASLAFEAAWNQN